MEDNEVRNLREYSSRTYSPENGEKDHPQKRQRKSTEK
jgi:hypothetical protein